MLSTDKQTDKETNQRNQKHNLLCQGVKNDTQYFISKQSLLLLLGYQAKNMQFARAENNSKTTWWIITKLDMLIIQVLSRSD